MRIKFTLALWACAGVLAAQPAQAQSLKVLIDQKIASGASAQLAPNSIPYAYTVSLNYRSSEGKDVEEFSGQYKVNLQAAPGSRIDFLGKDVADFPDEAQEMFGKIQAETISPEFVSEFWCVGDDEPFKDFAEQKIDVVRETDTEAVIALDFDDMQTLMDGDDGEKDDTPKKLKKRMAAELTLSKPDLHMKHMRFWLTKPTTIKLIAKIKEMNVEQSCALAPNGIPYVSEFKMRVSGKALGSSFGEDMHMTVSDLQPL